MMNSNVNILSNLTKAKWAFTTRRVKHSDIVDISTDYSCVVSGDLVLGQITKIGQHKRIQLASGRVSGSHVGDYVVLAVGDRYAPDQFEGVAKLDSDGSDLVAGGGVIGTVVKANKRMSKPTQIKPIGLLEDKRGEVVNIATYGLPNRNIPDSVTVIGVFGTSMNSGKTTTAASLAHGLMKAGCRVAGVKATGTGSFGDYNAFRDAGIPVLDFTDAGMATTYKMSIDRIEVGFETLVGTAGGRGADIVIVEFADGVFQQETSAILRNSWIRFRLDGILFASGDAAGAVGGVRTIRSHGLDPLAVSGLVSCSPLASLEAEKELGLPVLDKATLCSPHGAVNVMKPALRDGDWFAAQVA